MTAKLKCPACKTLEGRLVTESNRGDKIYNCKHCRHAWTVEKERNDGQEIR